MRSTAAFSLKKSYAYAPPEWAAKHFTKLPSHGRLNLANLPTPVYQPTGSSTTILQKFSNLDVTLLLKRDDMSGGVELGGNKIRKLEFLLAEALENGHDSVVTIGGEQSNHCRATACAARMVGLEPHLILRTKRADAVNNDTTEEFGVVGNIMLDRMVGSQIYTCTPGEYGRVGSNALVQRLCQQLEANEGKKPYAIPVGGSNGVGTWGYLEGVNELAQQCQELDHVVFACGSGGTASGIALGMGLCPTLHPQVHAVAVCDDPDYFYNHVSKIADEMGFQTNNKESTLDFVKNIMVVHQGKGLGYAASTAEELEFCSQFARETGVALDPVYSGKALYHFVTNVLNDSFRGSTVLFWHTGGALGMYDKELPNLEETSPVKRLDVYGKDQEGGVSI